MCRMCSLVAGNAAYLEKINSWFKRDVDRLERTRAKAASLTDKTIENGIFTNVKWPLEINFPLFEARAAFAVPTNYYQTMLVDGIRLRNDWQHDWLRSLALLDNGDLLVFTKALNFHAIDNQDWLIFYYLVRFEKSKNEFSMSVEESGKVTIAVNGVEKEGISLLNNEAAKHKFNLTFNHHPTNYTMVKKERAMGNALVKEVYGKSADMSMGKSDFEEYIITTPHFAPHGYLINDPKAYGFSTRMEFQNYVSTFFREHAK